jgi:hypothetical protein
MIKFTFILLCFLAFTATGFAQECRSIQNAADRLKCFDDKDAAQAVQQPSAHMSVVDFKTDKNDLQGKTVEIEGYLMNFGAMGLLLGEIGDMNPDLR